MSEVLITVPVKAISVNRRVLFNSKTKHVYQPQKIIDFKNKMFCELYRNGTEWAKQIESDDIILMELHFGLKNYYYKNGKLRRLDLDNMLQITINAIFEFINKYNQNKIDDSQIIRINCSKYNSDIDEIQIIINNKDKL